MFKRGAVVASSLLLLTSCAVTPSQTASPASSATPSNESSTSASPSISLPANDPAAFDYMLEVLANSCNNALAIGLHYRFDPPTSNGVSDVELAPAQTILKFFDPTNMMQKYNGDWQPGGFPDGDVLCADADWVTSYQNTKEKSPKGLNALYFESNVAKLSEGEYSFAIHRGSPEMRAFTYLVTDGLATEVDVPIGDTDVYRYVLQYGVSADDQALIKKLNEASN